MRNVAKLLAVFALGVLATCSAARAQGSGGGGGGGGGSPSSGGPGAVGSAPSTGGARSPNANGRSDGVFGDFGSFQTTSTIKGRIIGINIAEHRVTVENDKGKIKTFKLIPGAKVKSDKKADVGKTRDLTLEDFQTGQLVKVVYRDSDESVVELKIVAK